MTYRQMQTDNYRIERITPRRWLLVRRDDAYVVGQFQRKTDAFQRMLELERLTPADRGTIAAALDDARSQGLGDDDTVVMIANALMSESGFNETDANAIAYRAVHA